MDLTDVKKIYNERVLKFGETPESLGWRSWEQQKLRFEIIHSQMLIDADTKIYDLGCGFSDFLSFVKTKSDLMGDENYIGIDISEQMIARSKCKYPNSKFLVGDFLNAQTGVKADWIVCSGALNFVIKDQDIYQKLNSFLERHIDNADKGVIFNLITDKVDYRDEKLAYYSPSKVIDIASKYSKYYSIRADYPLYEFTCAIRKKI